MDIKNTLAKWYKGRAGTDSVFRGTSLEFPEILIDQCIIDLKVKEEAKSDGEGNVPNSEATSLSGTEQRLQVRFDGDKAYHTNMAQEVVNSYEKQCFNHDLEKKGAAFTGFELEVDNAHAQLKTKIRDDKIEVQEKLQSAQKEYDEFKINNKIERSSRTPRSDVRVFSIIGVLMLIETIINAGFMKDGIGSAINAALIALTLSAINIFLGFAVGRKVLTYKNHINYFFNFLSYLFFLIYAVFILILNFVIAHWRDLSTPKNNATFRDLNPEFMEAVTNAFTDPIINDTTSMIFLLIGIGFSFYALYEGYNSEDPYPGYGLVHRRLDDARDNYLGEKELSLKEIDYLREFFLAEIINKSDAIKHSYTATTQCTTELENFLSRFKTYMEQLDRYSYAVLSTYRNENEKNRSTKTPQYFDEKLIIKEPPILRNRLKELKQILIRSKPIINDLQNLIEKMNKYIWKINNSTRKEFEELENF